MEGRERILKLLGDKIITVEEAKILLDALETRSSEKGKEDCSDKKDKKENCSETFSGFEQKLDKFSNELGSFVRDSLKIVEEKIEEFFKTENKEK